MDNPEQNDLPEMPAFIGEALDRETLAPETLLVMCGLTTDEIADELAEFGTEVESRYGLSEQEEVLEQTAYRVAVILDTISEHINEQALGTLGKEFIYNTASLTISQVALEQRAVIRHRAGELDHDCQKESCPISDYSWLKIEQSGSSDLYSNSGQTFASKLEAPTFDSEWE